MSHRIFLFSLLLPLAVAYAADPFVPPDDTVLLEVAPADALELVTLRALRRRAEAAPPGERVAAAAAYARAAIERARRRQDPRWYGYAEAVLAPWWSAADPPLPVRVLRATIAQHRHAFDAALADLDAVLAQRPDHLQARITRATIHTVQARYAAAIADCAPLSRVDALLALACSGGARSLAGDAAAVHARLDRWLALPLGAPDIRLWAMTLRAEIAERLGLPETDAQYRAALAAPGGGKDAYLRLAYADFLLDAGRPAEAKAVLDPVADTDGGLLRLLRARRMAGETGDFALQRQRLLDRFAAARARGDAPHYREEAMLAVMVDDRPEDGLWLARRNWQSQREPLDARLLLMAAVKSGQLRAAEPVLRWYREHDIEDVRLAPLVARLDGGEAELP